MERGSERGGKSEEGRQHVCECVCDCVGHAQLLVLLHTLSKAITNSIGNFVTFCRIIYADSSVRSIQELKLNYLTMHLNIYLILRNSLNIFKGSNSVYIV